MSETKLQELEEMAAKAVTTAQRLPPGPERSNMLKEIEEFRRG